MRASIAREIRNLKQELLWKESEEKLLQEKRQIELAIAQNYRATEEMSEGWQERDSPSEDEIRDVEYSHRENLQAMLHHIDEALERLTNKTFGRCVDCGKKIEGKRLQIAPTVARCLACQSLLEGNSHRATL
jgi:DnaK suppressor protein